LDDASGWTTWAYDLRGRVIGETKSISGAGTYITQYGYDGLDRVISTTYPTGEVVTQTYNSLGAVAGVRQANGQWYAKSLAYNANGSLAKLGLGNDYATTTYAYYGLGGGAPAINSFRLWQVETKQGSTPWLKMQYQYDPVGNVKTITDVTNSGQVLAFTYDMLDRLTTAATK
jgi:YD repeat-containing protein